MTTVITLSAHEWRNTRVCEIRCSNLVGPDRKVLLMIGDDAYEVDAEELKRAADALWAGARRL